MPAFRSLSIRNKLRRMMMLTCIATLVLSTAINAGLGIIHQIEKIKHRLTQVASMHDDSASEALSVNDEVSGQRILKALRKNPDIVIAALYRTNNQLFASHTRADTKTDPPAASPPAGFHSLREIGFHIIGGDEKVRVVA